MKPTSEIVPHAMQQLALGEEAKQEGIDRADRAADPLWKKRALQIVQGLAARREEFTTDAVWSHLEHMGLGVREPKALGAIIQQAARSGMIESTGRYVKSVRPECHARPIPVWKSKICQKVAA